MNKLWLSSLDDFYILDDGKIVYSGPVIGDWSFPEERVEQFRECYQGVERRRRSLQTFKEAA